jgi:hypothetical protein
LLVMPSRTAVTDAMPTAVPFAMPLLVIVTTPGAPHSS